MPENSTAPQTLFALSGRIPPVADLQHATLVLIDCQNEYVDGDLPLSGISEACGQAVRLLQAARRYKSRIVHVAHRGGAGGMFDRAARRGQLIDLLTPQGDEVVIEKPRPNSFSGTELESALGPAGTPLLLAGFMTHMCVSSTARAALDLGWPVTIAADACATRDLPLPGGGIIRAAQLHAAELAALSDRFAAIADTQTILDLS
ncbi:MAG: cysteine hydrolase family protein [Bosea sp. (in: a-proteobacteria)]